MLLWVSAGALSDGSAGLSVVFSHSLRRLYVFSCIHVSCWTVQICSVLTAVYVQDCTADRQTHDSCQSDRPLVQITQTTCTVVRLKVQ